MVLTEDVLYQPATILTDTSEKARLRSKVNQFIVFVQHLIFTLFSRSSIGFLLHRVNAHYKLSNKRNDIHVDLLSLT